MAKALGRTTVALYRELRARQSPEEAIVALRDHLRIAQVYAYRTARDTYAAELGDEVTRLTGWLEDVRNRAMQPGRHGKYWQTGKFQGSLTFEVQRYFPNGQQTGSVECGNAGCAIKHAFAWLRQYPEGHALILANRPFPMVTVDANVTMARLIRLSWPADQVAGDRRPERTGIIPGMLGDSPHRPRAASLQRSLNTADHVLTNLARQQHPTVAWWWGVRKVDGIMCAWCYVCDRSIVEGALNVGITEAQTDAIETHKQSHWQQAMAALADPEGF